MKYSIAVFDLDGTILDTLNDLAGSVNHALCECGYPKRSIAEVRDFVGNGIRNLVARSVPEGTSERDAERVFGIFKEHYAAHCNDSTGPYDGIDGLLASLKRAGMKIAVVSNKSDSAVRTLMNRHFSGLFDAAVGEREGIRRKPAPDSVNEILSLLRCSKSDAVYIGDSEVDIDTAANAGIPCICVDWGFRDRDVLEKKGAGIIVSTPGALEGILLS